jgi:hypothetical protein
MKFTVLIVTWMICAAAMFPTAAHATVAVNREDGLSLLFFSYIIGKQHQEKLQARGGSSPCGFVVEPDGKVDHNFSGRCRPSPCTAEEKNWCAGNAVNKVCQDQDGRANCIAGESAGHFSCYVYCS